MSLELRGSENFHYLQHPKFFRFSVWLDDSEVAVDTMTNQRRAVQGETNAGYHDATM